MADGLVQQDAGPARAEHHRHGARGGRARFEVGEGLRDRLLGVLVEHGIGEMRVVGAPAAAGGAAFAPAVLLGDHLHRQAHQRTHVGGELAVGPRDEHHLVFAAEARHHLRDARIARAALALDPLEQRDLFGGGERGDRVDRGIEGHRQLARAGFHDARLARIGDGARRLCRVLQGVEADLVGVGERRLLARDGAHAHALLDVEAARLDDAFLEAPAFGARVLEVKVGVIDFAHGERAEDAFKLARLQFERREQGAFGGVQYQCILRLAFAGSAAWTSRMRDRSISASTTPSPSGCTARISPQGSTIMLWP